MKRNSLSDKTGRSILLILGLVFLFILAFESSRKYSLDTNDSIVHAISSAGQTEEDQQAVLPALTHYTEIIERPLFTQDRRPFIPEENIAETKPSPRKTPAQRRQEEDLSLSAIIITGDKRIALVQSGRAKKLQKIALGEELNGWTLSDIQPDRISLERNGEVKHLELMVKASPKQPRRRATQERKNNASANAVTILDDKEELNAPVKQDQEDKTSDSPAGKNET